MKVLIVSEGKHELGRHCADGALPILTDRLLGGAAEFACEKVSSRKVRVHLEPGKRGRYTKRALGWIRLAEREGFDAIVLVIDQDNQPERVQGITTAQETPFGSIRRALGVAIRTFDAWMLADEHALSEVLGRPIARQRAPEEIKNPKKRCRNLAADAMGLAEMYSAVARVADMATLRKRCRKGFAPFADRVLGL